MQWNSSEAVVPGYYLVCYNLGLRAGFIENAVVPGYYLVCYNGVSVWDNLNFAVVPGYYLVCYNFACTSLFLVWL